ncbi:hypothetical protein BU25DRAFT_414335 [Macroventuria anomochaeta]|uniref:Uncharacterized protein n=1 Tax=Macroventuria anomochaeta TaxID=301207 RepID=A0ACB6RP57_9PLEO|nr:uncharacterized protein BU25DRAFT_414335 [Macroventuria anomochaeta]KAF2623598.1 hypothetical protein BU25DRAFT_414335 [Macroventuria anomochaeta]
MAALDSGYMVFETICWVCSPILVTTTPHHRKMNGDELADYLRYLLDLQGRPRAPPRSPGAQALLDVEPADLDRLCACLWVAPASSTARRELASILSTGPALPLISLPGCTEEDLDAWVREAYHRCTDTDIVRDGSQILVKDVALTVARDKLRDLLQVICPDISDIICKRFAVVDATLWRLATAQDMAKRAVGVKMYMDKLDGI